MIFLIIEMARITATHMHDTGYLIINTIETSIKTLNTIIKGAFYVAGK